MINSYLHIKSLFRVSLVLGLAFVLQNTNAQKILNKETSFTPTKAKLLILKDSEQGEVIHSFNLTLKPDTSGMVSYVFGKEGLEQSIIEDLKASKEKYVFKIVATPATEPVNQTLFIENIIKEEKYVRDSVFFEVTKRVFTKNEQKEYLKEQERLKIEAAKEQERLAKEAAKKSKKK